MDVRRRSRVLGVILFAALAPAVFAQGPPAPTPPLSPAQMETFLLKARTKSAVAALRPIGKRGGIAALGAKMTLERYERGDLDIR